MDIITKVEIPDHIEKEIVDLNSKIKTEQKKVDILKENLYKIQKRYIDLNDVIIQIRDLKACLLDLEDKQRTFLKKIKLYEEKYSKLLTTGIPDSIHKCILCDASFLMVPDLKQHIRDIHRGSLTAHDPYSTF